MNSQGNLHIKKVFFKKKTENGYSKIIQNRKCKDNFAANLWVLNKSTKVISASFSNVVLIPLLVWAVFSWALFEFSFSLNPSTGREVAGRLGSGGWMVDGWKYCCSDWLTFTFFPRGADAWALLLLRLVDFPFLSKRC